MPKRKHKRPKPQSAKGDRKAPSARSPRKSAKKQAKGSGDKTHRGGSKEPHIELVNYARALSNELRFQVLAILAQRVASPKEISGELPASLGSVSYHVVVLRDCGVIVEDHHVQRRGAVEHFYRAVQPTLVSPDAWKDLPPSLRKGVTIRMLKTFFDDASSSLQAGLFDHSPGDLSFIPLILDEQALAKLTKLKREFQSALAEVQGEARTRLTKGKGKSKEAKSVTVFLVSFLSTRNPKR